MKKENIKNLLLEEIEGVKFSIETLNCLNHNLIFTLGDITRYNILDLRKLRGINYKIWQEIQNIIEYYYNNINEA